MVEQLLIHANVATTAGIPFNKAVQVWVQVLLVKVVKPLDQPKPQSK
jgi:hypothetical protein